MIFEADSLQTFLREEFARRVRVNPRYSLRAYARALGLSSGSLSEILRARRPLTFKNAAKIARSLGLNEVETKKLYEFVGEDRQRSLSTSAVVAAPLAKSAKQLDQDTFQLVSEWQHFAILNLLDCADFEWKATHIAKRLGLTHAQAQFSMELLLRIGLVKKAGAQAKAAHASISSPSGIPSAAVRSFHRQMLEKAIEALELQPIEEREMNGVGFAVDPARLPQIKKDLDVFLDQITTKYANGKKREVYYLETALFKLTQGASDERD